MSFNHCWLAAKFLDMSGYEIRHFCLTGSVECLFRCPEFQESIRRRQVANEHSVIGLSIASSPPTALGPIISPHPRP
jgi:hypothetical protein